MKIIGLTEIPGAYTKTEAYICVITKDELLKVANKARYSDGADKFPFPKVGDDYPIAEGYDFRDELARAIQAMTEAYTKFAKVAPVAAQFAGIVLTKEGEQP